MKTSKKLKEQWNFTENGKKHDFSLYSDGQRYELAPGLKLRIEQLKVANRGHPAYECTFAGSKQFYQCSHECNGIPPGCAAYNPDTYKPHFTVASLEFCNPKLLRLLRQQLANNTRE